MSSEIVGVSTGELGRLAGELRESGGAVGGAARTVADHPVGPGELGAHYAAEGAAIRAGLEVLGQRLTGWSGATVAAAEAIQVSVDRQAATDRSAFGG
ncbi:hypothetical protein [Nocardia sp. NPDC057353]|uniref:hypothetical protein n=1 Tax=Nocardia sp. NPDC057353 TaxID=3346104 RepID=UPI00363C23BC